MEYCNYFSYPEYSILEIGVGTGELLNKIKGKRKVGIDFSEKIIERAREQFPSLEFHVMAAEEISLNEKFDLIIGSNLIGYEDDLQMVVEQLEKVCYERKEI